MPPAAVTNGNFRVLLPVKSLEFTGERMTTAVEGPTEFEHFHRYCLARDLCQGRDVLDVASGEGYGSAILASVGRSVIGVEIEAGTVAHAAETYRGDNLRFIQGSASNLPLEDACVDVVVSFETLEHIREHEQFVLEVRRVLRPGGTFIVSTPDRSIYSGRLESFNQFHLLELVEAEFEALLRTHFAHVVILYQRAILGSVIAATQKGGQWRSYERRATEYIEASSGLSRSPYLIGVASDADLPHVASSAYIDRRGVGEVILQFMRAPELERERDAARAAQAEAERERDAARAAQAEAERERDAARAAQAEAERERNAARAAQAEAERERDAARAAFARSFSGWINKLRRKTRP
jgi:ubiquinone/menaquinone biosynthesis C-methylase UbiE